MISKIVFTTVLTMFLSGGIYNYNKDFDEAPAAATAQTNDEVREDTVKAIFYNGEVIPLVELPTVEITAKRKFSDLANAVIVDGQIYPSYELEEVVITPES